MINNTWKYLVTKCTTEYKNRISLEDSSVPKWVLGQYRNTLFSNMVAFGGSTPGESKNNMITTYIEMFACYEKLKKKRKGI